jgi:hypothetical protein
MLYNWKFNANANQLINPQLLAAGAIYNKNHFVAQDDVSPQSMTANTIASIQSQTLNSANIIPQETGVLYNKSTFTTNLAGANLATNNELLFTGQLPYVNKI